MIRKERKGLGMGAPSKSHQRIVARVIRKLTLKVSEAYENNFALDTTLDVDWKNGEKKIRPDIAFYKYGGDQDGKDILKDVLFVMEIVNNAGVKYSVGRIKGIFNREPSLKEGFLYNFEKETWTRFTKKDGKIVPESTTYSLTFKCDIASVVKSRVEGVQVFP